MVLYMAFILILITARYYIEGSIYLGFMGCIFVIV